MTLFRGKGFIGRATAVAGLAGLTAILAVVIAGDAGPLIQDEIRSRPPEVAREVSSLGVKPQSHDCEIAELPRDGKEAVGRKVSADGEYIAGELADPDDAITTEHALWHDGGYDVVADDEGEDDHELVDVNSAGVVLGDTDDYDGGHGEDALAWIDAGDDTTWLTFPGAERVRPQDLNEAGDVVANSDDVLGRYPGDDEPEEIVVTTPVLWPGGDAEPVELEVEAGAAAEVVAVTDGGMALGYQYELDDLEHRQPKPRTERPWVWSSNGRGWPLPDTTAPPEAPYRVDVSGDWVLWSTVESDYRFRLSDPGRIEWLNDELKPSAIDAAGRVYGYAFRNERAAPVRQDDDAELVELPMTRGPGEAGYGSVEDVSRDGSTLVGEAAEGGDTTDPLDVAVTWTCGG